MSRHAALAAGALALLAFAGSASSAFAIRNHYDREEANELGYFMIDAFGGVGPNGEPLHRSAYDVRGGRYLEAPRRLPPATGYRN